MKNNIYFIEKKCHSAANHSRMFGITPVSSDLKTVLKDAIKNVEDQVNR